MTAMFLRRLFLSCALLSIGLALPTVAYTEESHQFSTEALKQSEEQIPSTPNSISEADASAAMSLRLQVEDRFESVEDGEPLSYRFSGRENEIVVVYTQFGSNYGSTEVLLQIDGREGDTVSRLYYPSIDFAESEGYHSAFKLPKTGVYYLSIDSELADAPDAALSVRSASYYERLMIAVEEKMDERKYDDAATLAGLAIAQRPELPMPYVSRIFAYSAKIYDSPAFLEEVSGLEAPGDILEAMRDGFLTLAPVEQANAVSDLRQVLTTYENAVENGMVSADDIQSTDAEFVAGFGHVADFLETGEVTEAIMTIFFEADR